MDTVSERLAMGRQAHWESVYRTRSDDELSWFQVQPAVSLSLIEGLRPAPRRAIDAGGGQSPLAGELLARGIKVAVLDISAAAIERARKRLGPGAGRVRWIVADVLEPQDLGPFDLWHDRAVFHFLTDREDRRRYVQAASRAVPEGGHAIVATFAPSAPEMCSGLPVHRYDAAGLASEFAPAFSLVDSATDAHATPWGKVQDFTYAVLQRGRLDTP